MKIKTISYLLLFVCLVICPTLGFSEVTFSDLDITPENILLFKARVDLPGGDSYNSYETLFLSTLKDKKIKQLTFFPEEIMLLNVSGQLQIQNRFGVFRSDANLRNIAPVDLFPCFVNGKEIESGKINPIQSSPDGKYLIYARPTKATIGDLTLYDIEKSRETIISKEFELSLNKPIVIWSYDSRYLIYSTENSLYYFSINQYLENRVIAEQYRKVCDGKLPNICWDKSNNLYYISGSLVSRIRSNGFFTQSLYSLILKLGKIAGNIPFVFDPNFDSFWISPDGQKVLLNKGGQNLFLCYLDAEDLVSEGSAKSLPYLYLPRNTSIKRVIWANSDILTILAMSIENGKSKSSLFRLEIPFKGDIPMFKQTEDKELIDIVFSPDESKVAILKKNNVFIYNYTNWKKEKNITFSKPISAVFINESELLIAGAYTYQLYNLDKNTSRFIALSQPGDPGLSEDSGMICTKIDNIAYRRTLAQENWKTSGGFTVREKEIASSHYRVYLEVSTRGSYKNIIMVRDIKGFGTSTLFPLEEFEYEKIPLKEESVNFDNFSHGKRTRIREVALVFNVIDSIKGLGTILNTLAEYRLRCTFFINGDAIRSYPEAIKEIAGSGHEVGSLFYFPFDMTDFKFNVDKKFIKLGLARTEDEYFAVTGKEISLCWHAPYYSINTAMILAAKEMNYTYVSRDIDSMDWATQDDSSITSGIYLGASQLVERIIEKKKPGSIIPILVGVPKDKRKDYLFQKLDILINNLIKRGYRIVPVSSLIENAK